MPQRKRVTLHPLLNDGTPDESVNLYPKTLTTGIVDEEGNEFPPQEKLVSGTNIKTINNQSLLGSGDIHIEGIETNWGDIGGILSNQTDLQEVLDEKASKIADQEFVGDNEFSGTNTFSNIILGEANPISDDEINLGSSNRRWYRVYTSEITDGMISLHVSDIENYNNRVTSLSNQSTDTTYPTAKCVWDNLVNVREVAEGKCKSIIISYNATIPTEETFAANTYKKGSDGTYFQTFAELKQYVGGSILSIENTLFNSQNASINTTQESVLTVDNYVYRLSEYDSDLKRGDIILVTETDVPDRWFSGGGVCYKLETSKVPLENYVTLGTAQTITGEKTFTSLIKLGLASIKPDDNAFKVVRTSDDANLFYANTYHIDTPTHLPLTNNLYDLGSSSVTWKNLYLSGNINFDTNHSVYFNGSDLFIKGSTVWFEGTYFAPKTHNTSLLGTAANAWKDLYLTGKVDFNGVASAKIDNNLLKFYYGNSAGFALSSNTLYVNFTLSAAHIRPQINNTYDIGTSSLKYKDLYLSGNIKGAVTLTQAQYDALVSGGTVDADTFYFIEEE